MAYPTPVTHTLNNIATADFINYKGVQYAVATVGSTTAGHEGINNTATITITVNAATITLNLTDADTVVQSTYIDADGQAHTVWAQSVNA